MANSEEAFVSSGVRDLNVEERDACLREKDETISELRRQIKALKAEMKDMKVKQQLEKDRRRASVVLGLPGAEYDNDMSEGGGQRLGRTTLTRTSSMRRMSRTNYGTGFVFTFPAPLAYTLVFGL